ncbi:MAG: MmgE/PrpD family protein [Gammaproteobacteria bacterium]|nr:MmgE/PrpD family protein [Gammaproteobacteria bacterium]
MGGQHLPVAAAGDEVGERSADIDADPGQAALLRLDEDGGFSHSAPDFRPEGFIMAACSPFIAGEPCIVCPAMGALTESIIDFLCGPAPARAPEKAREIAVTGFIDCIGVALAGAVQPVARNLWRAEQGGPPESRLLLSAKRLPAARAALIGSAAAHALDLDDYAFANHTSAVLVPPILAEAEVVGASGARMLGAYLAGFEVWGVLARREQDYMQAAGWHPTGVYGPVGAAAALSWLRGLPRAETRNALGLAAAAGGGVMDNFGTQAKPYQAARAAEAGLAAVRRALAGLDAGPHALDGPGGFLQTISPQGRVDCASPASELGKDWYMARHGLNIKRYPVVGAAQRCVDAALQLRGDHDFDASALERVTARISEGHSSVMRFRRPSDAMQAKFSLEFAVSAALLSGRLGLKEMRDDWVRRSDVQALMQRVERMEVPDDDPVYPVGARYDAVSVLPAEGSEIMSEPVYRYRGHGRNPLSRPELRAKFMNCAVFSERSEQAAPSPDVRDGQDVLPPPVAVELFERLERLAELDSVKDLPELPLEGLFSE